MRQRRRGGSMGRVGGSNHTARYARDNASSITAPPEEASIIFWFDTSDITTLWKDTAGTDPVTADSDVVAAITNKGSAGGLATHDTADNRPSWDATKGRISWGGNDSLAITAEAYATDLSHALLGSEGNPTQSVKILWEWDSFAATGIRVDFTDIDMTTWNHNAGFTYAVPGDAFITAESADSFSSVATSTDNSQVVYFNTTESTVTDNEVHWDGTATDIRLGANNSAGSNGWVGHLGELIIWSGVVLTAADVATLAQRDLEKFGTVWV